MPQNQIDGILRQAEREAEIMQSVAGTIHVLLALLEADVVAVKQMCKAYKFTSADVKRHMCARLNMELSVVEGECVISRMKNEAEEIAQKYSRPATPMFLVLVLLRDKESVAIEILKDIGVNIECEIGHIMRDLEG